MTKVPTINVLVANNKEALVDYLDALKSPKTKALPNNFEGMLLFSNKTNSNFISFEHSFVGENTTMTLKFIDPKNTFEANYLSTGSIYSSLTTIANNLTKDIFSKSKDVKESIENLPDTKQEYINLLTSKSLNRPIYVLYGSGDDPTAWSDIHRVVVHGLSFEPEKGRLFTMVMQGLERSLNPLGRVTMSGSRINVEKFYSVEAVGNSNTIYFDSPYAYSAPNSQSTPIDYHLLIVDTISDYLKKCSNGANVIVLLPDLNKVLSEAIKQSGLTPSWVAGPNSGPGAATKLREEVLRVLTDINMDMSVEENRDYLPEVTPGQVTPLLEQKKKFTDKKTDDNFYSLYQHRAEIKSNSFGLDSMDFISPLKTICRSINQQSINQYVIDPIAYSETNTDLNDLWGSESNKRRYLFNGYDDFDSTQPTLVFGDDGMITSLLMPREDQKDFPKEYIHPFVAEDLLRNDYQEAAKKIVTDLRVGYSFGDLSEVPDIFKYSNKTLLDEATKLAQQNNIPVFRHNTKNPNVLRIKQDNDSPAYLAEMNLAFQKQQQRVASLVAEGGVITNRVRDFPITNMDELKTAIATAMFSNYGSIATRSELVQSIMNRINQPGYAFTDASIIADLGYRTTKLNPDIQEQREKGDTDIEGFVKYYIYRLSDKKALDIRIPQEVNANPATVISQMATQLSKRITTLTVNTLPLYAISSYTEFLGSPVILFSQDPPMQGQVYPRRNKINSYLTGIYRIIGFKHTLSERKAESEFLLSKASFAVPQVELMRDEDLPNSSDPFMYNVKGKSKDTPFNKPLSDEIISAEFQSNRRLTYEELENQNYNQATSNVRDYQQGILDKSQLSEIDLMILSAMEGKSKIEKPFDKVKIDAIFSRIENIFLSESLKEGNPGPPTFWDIY